MSHTMTDFSALADKLSARSHGQSGNLTEYVAALREAATLEAENAELRKNAERNANRAISDLALIYGLIEQGQYDEAQECCKGSAEMYTQELADAALRSATLEAEKEALRHKLAEANRMADKLAKEDSKECKALQRENAELRRRMLHIGDSNADDWRWYQNQARQACRALGIDRPGLDWDDAALGAQTK